MLARGPNRRLPVPRATPQVIAAVNELCVGPLHVMIDLFQASIRLIERRRVGSCLSRRYEAAGTPLDCLVDRSAGASMPGAVRARPALRRRTDPFELAARIERQLEVIERTQDGRPAPIHCPVARRPAPPPRGGGGAEGSSPMPSGKRANVLTISAPVRSSDILTT